MKITLVTSAVTFVPDNYKALWSPLLQHPNINAIIVLDNRNWDIFIKACLLLLTGAAPKMGWQILSCFLPGKINEKKTLAKKHGKKFFNLKKLSSQEGLDILRSLQPDILLNARTREIFSSQVLSTPKIAAWNIHHGLLPNQRGLMCDFWAHLESTECGFTIHEMTEKIDAGRILKAQEVEKSSKSYLQYTAMAAAQEAEQVQVLIEQLKTEKVPYQENTKTQKTIYRRNPKLRDFYKLRYFKGVKI